MEEHPAERGGKHPLMRMFLIGAIASAIGVAIGLAIDWFPTDATSSADEIDTLWDVLIIVSVLAAYAWIVLDDVEAKKQNELTVDVYGQQFSWRFDYPQPGGNAKPVRGAKELWLPKDRPVYFRIHTDDVIHSFWVPQFLRSEERRVGKECRSRWSPYH